MKHGQYGHVWLFTAGYSPPSAQSAMPRLPFTRFSAATLAFVAASYLNRYSCEANCSFGERIGAH